MSSTAGSTTVNNPTGRAYERNLPATLTRVARAGTERADDVHIHLLAASRQRRYQTPAAPASTKAARSRADSVSALSVKVRRQVLLISQSFHRNGGCQPGHCAMNLDFRTLKGPKWRITESENEKGRFGT